MPVGITDLAHSIRKNTSGTAVPIPLNRGQQLVCAALGHKSLASFQSALTAEHEPQSFDSVAHVVPDYDLVVTRAQELDIDLPDGDLRTLIARAFAERAPTVSLHETFGAMADVFHGEVTAAIESDDDVNSAMANANYDGVDEVYLEEEIDPTQGTINEPLRLMVAGHVSLGIDVDRPYSGHKIDFDAVVTMARCGRRCFEPPQVEVLSAGLDYDWGESDDRMADGPQRTLAEALAEELKIDLADADELSDVEAQELTGHSGEMTYGYLFDFTGHASPELATKLMQRHGSLKLEVGPSFFDTVRAEMER